MARSKRKTSDDAASVAIKKRKEEQFVLHDSSVFGELVNKAGYVLKSGDKSNELGCDQIIFQRDLERAIKRDAHFPQVVDEFTEALSNHIEVSSRLLRALMPTITSTSCDSSIRCGNQDSLLRLLLGIDQLQPAIMKLLLEKLAEFTEDDEPVMNGNEQVNMPRLILSQFRWLNNIVNSQEITEKMLEIISVVSLDTQREIIMCIPEVIDDADHNNVAEALKILLTENTQLTVPILDVLSNLTLKEELLAEVRRSVISTLGSVLVTDLPVIVRFLLQTVSATEAVDVISEFRQHLDFNSSFDILPTSKSKRQEQFKKESSKRSSEALILDSIRSAIRFQRSIADAWIKAIEGVDSATDHRAIDVFAVFILHTCGHKKTVEALVRSKVRAGHFTELLLKDTFTDHTQLLREYFSTILALCEVLLRSPERVISAFAAAMYQGAFLSFDAYCQQEIVGSLVTHIGSGLPSEVDVALDIMCKLARSHTKEMAPFGIFVKGVLDYLQNLSIGQIRKLYGMLSALAFHSSQGESQIQDELYIIIRKQLSNTDLKYKRMGVIGAIMVVQSLSTSIDYPDFEGVAVLPDDVLKNATNLLNLVRASTSSCPPVNALFMDELSTMVAAYNLDPNIETCISEQVLSDFQEHFIIDVTPAALEQNAMLSMEPQFALDSGNVDAIGINLLPIITKAITDSSSDDKVVSAGCLSPEFRLLQTCERRQNKTLGDIDALLGCPVYLPKAELVDKMESMLKMEKHAMCDSLLLTINWFRELVNAFASQIDPEIKAKVILRLQHLTDLQNLIPKYLSVTSGYCPPSASFDGEAPSAASTSGEAVKRGRAKKGAKKGARKGQAKGANKTMNDTSVDGTQGSPADVGAATTQDGGKEAVGSDGVRAAGVQWAPYRVYLRELDMDVFHILQAGLLTRNALDTELNVKDTSRIELQPPQLELLLDDLVQKLEHIILASASTRRNPFKSKSRQTCVFSHLDQLGPLVVVKKVIKLMPALCNHLEATSAFFQALVAANDGLLDGPGSNTTQANQIASCFHLLLVTISAVCSWSGFAGPEHRDLIKELLSSLSLRLNPAASTQSSLPELIFQGFQYIENFSSTIPNLSTAVTLIRVLVSLAERGDTEVLRTKIADLAVEFLRREWRSPDGQLLKGAATNELLTELLRTYLSYSADPLTALDDLATTGFAELLQAEKGGFSESYPTLSKNSFPTFFRVMLVRLVEYTRHIKAYSQKDTQNDKVDRLLQWGLAVRIFHVHINVAKVNDARSNLISILKYGRQFVDVFLRLGMPLLDHTFRQQHTDVQSLLKNLQLSTRSLHNMAGHSKIIRDVCLTNLVPPLKKSLESFVYRVKAMLTLNRCMEAFWLGTLKNRDLHGAHILTPSTTTEDSEGDEDSLPDEDHCTEGEAEAAEGSESSDSYSESY